MAEHDQISYEDLDAETRVISVGGEVDLYSAPEFKEALEQALEADRRRIVLDFSEATFIDSTALGVIMSGSKRLSAKGGSLAIVCSNPAPLRVFQIAGFDRLLPFYGSRDEALRALTDEPSG